MFALAWVWLSLRSDTPLHPDSGRDLAFARDLVDGAELHLQGASASFASLEQGTAWIDLLALCQRLGLGLVGIDRVMTTLLAGSVAVAYLGITRVLARIGGAGEEHRSLARLGSLAGTVLLLASLPAVCEMPMLWQPLLLPVPIVLLHLALWRVLDRGALIDALALALFCALALDIHVISIALVIPSMVAIPLACRRPGLATGASMIVGLGYTALSSATAAVANLVTGYQDGWLLPGLGACAVVLAAAWVLRSRFKALGLRRRIELVVALEASLVAVVVIASLLPSTPPLAGRYLLPFVPALGLAVALVAVRGGSLRRAWSVLGFAVLLLLASWPMLRPSSGRELPRHPAWSQAEFELVARELHGRGLTWTELVGRLQGPDYEVVLGGLSAWVDPGPIPAPTVESGLLLVGLEPRLAASVLDELPSTTTIFELPEVTVALVETSARVDRLGASVCTDEGECAPVTLAVNRRVNQARPDSWIGERPARAWLAKHGEQATKTWRFPVRAGPKTTLALLTVNAPRCAWQIVAVEGFELAGLPATVIELPTDAAGSLTIARIRDDDDSLCRRDQTSLPPAWSELDPAWSGLLQALTRRHGAGITRSG